VLVPVCVIVRCGRRAGGERGDRDEGELRVHGLALAEWAREREAAHRRAAVQGRTPPPHGAGWAACEN
jgi:hypothetical protein